MRFHSCIIAAAVIVLASACGGKTAHPSVSSLSHAWLEIKITLPENTAGVSGLEAKLDDFTGALDRFFASPVGGLYQIQRPYITRPAAAIDESAGRLKAAAKAGDRAAVFAAMLEIDTALDQLQSIDAGLSDIIQLRYFQLFFFFALLVIMTILALHLVNRRLEKAVNREQQSLIFSRETLLAQEQERARLARELHDTVAQDLWRLTFRTDSINKAAGEGERRLLCEEVLKEQRELIRRVRTICDALIPPDFGRRGLLGALRSLCYDFAQRTGIKCDLTVQEGLRLDPLDADKQLQCFRIVQECLANIEKHAQAGESAVLVCNGEPRGGASAPPVLRISVSDNGRGFTAPDRDSRLRLRAEGRFGLWSMYERAASLRGTLVMDSEAGGGTVITLETPLVQEDTP
ncbi:MAG: sensor histidine kinase [Treponema sp.]|nr:sensor histidine kinase [Treponema sp.]